MVLNITEERQKARKVVEEKSFDYLIMFLICLDGLVFGLLTIDFQNLEFIRILFLLDRLCMAIFIIEMLMKMYAYGPKFFKSGWNVFDLSIITISSIPIASYLIVLRTFRLFRLLRYVNRFKQMKTILNILITLLPNFFAMSVILGVFLYVFAILAVGLFGETFVEFADLGAAMLSLIQSLTVNGWINEIIRPVMAVYPNSWIFFLSFSLSSCLIIISFLFSVITLLVHREFKVGSNL